ncbi:MAG: methyltransferase family protein [Elusimicrobiota bacterium]
MGPPLLPYVLTAIIIAGELPTLGRRRPDAAIADHGSYRLIKMLFALGYGSAFFLCRRPPFFGIWASWLGGALVLFGTTFRLWAIRVLGRYFTRIVAISPDQRVIESGPYRLIRHPAYTGSLAASIGVALSLRGEISFLCLCLPVCAAFWYRIRVEERALALKLGDSYRLYMGRTKRLIPLVF